MADPFKEEMSRMRLQSEDEMAGAYSSTGTASPARGWDEAERR